MEPCTLDEREPVVDFGKTFCNMLRAPTQPSENRLSGASKAGISVGVAFAVIVACGILYLLYWRIWRASQNQALNDNSAMGNHKPSTMEPRVAEPKEGGKPLDSPPAYPYELATPIHKVAGTLGSTSDTPGNNRSECQPHIPNMESSDSSNAGFYAQSFKRDKSHQSQQDPDMISYHNRPEIDGKPLHEAPESSEQHKESTVDDITTSKPSSQPPVNEGPDYVDLDHLSKLEQEERLLQEDIAQIERLERLKVERDRVRQRIRDLSEQPRRDSTEGVVRVKW
ncbi:MAG: hypothetical protein Q9226_005781 [Calogaya cf. arnoldii]